MKRIDRYFFGDLDATIGDRIWFYGFYTVAAILMGYVAYTLYSY